MENGIKEEYMLYCGQSEIKLGNLSEGEVAFTDVEYYDTFISDCLDLRISGKFHILGDAAFNLDKIKQQFKYIEAAGGLVVNDSNQTLVIVRNGLYDLPKGKLEPGELTDQAAIREVMEETGVPNPVLERKLLDTYHFYRYGSDPTIIFKKTYWYLMSHDGSPATKPQLEESITECFWADDVMLASMPDKTHRNLRILFQLKSNGEI